MNSARIMWINSAIFLLMLLVSVFTLMRKPEFPSPPDLDGARREVQAIIMKESTNTNVVEERLPNLGQKNLFSTIIALPTPTPAPTRTPDPGPSIEEVLANYKLSVALKSFANFQDQRTQKETMVKLNESFQVDFKGKSYEIKLIEIDSKKFTAVVEMKNLIGEKQTKSYSMF
jgi:hypothetical protein